MGKGWDREECVWWQHAAAHLECEQGICLVLLSATAGCAPAGHSQAWWLSSGQHSLTAPSPDVSPMDAVSAGAQKDELTLRIVVRMPPQHIIKGVSVGCLGAKDTSWGWVWCCSTAHFCLAS